jgi:arsenite methyltransferase
VPQAALDASLGCGVPTAVADLHEGEAVLDLDLDLDLGSGAGADVLISARRVGPTGKAIGLDMTDEMLELARANAAQAGVSNVEFLKGYLEDTPLEDASVDVVISNCVINLSIDKPQVIREAARVLRTGGRFAVSDVIADPETDDATRADTAAWTGCVAGALTETEFLAALQTAGFEAIEIRQTHRVHEHAAAAIIRACKPAAGNLWSIDLTADHDQWREALGDEDKRLVHWLATAQISTAVHCCERGGTGVGARAGALGDTNDAMSGRAGRRSGLLGRGRWRRSCRRSG